MKKYFLSAFILVLFSTTLTNCGGYDDDIITDPEEASLTLEKQSYKQGEVPLNLLVL